jgi:hypothetical protein
MGAYNRLFTGQTEICPACGEQVPLIVQFKYGNTWQFDYFIGETLRWGGNDIGSPAHERVLVYGAPDLCTNCGRNLRDEHFEILIEKSKIISCSKSSEHLHEFAARSKTFLVLDGP